MNDEITVAILAKNKAHCLPLYLKQIESQTYPADKIRLYIRTNNNSDATPIMLKDWADRVRDRYLEIHFDASDVPEPVHAYAPHEWNGLRLKVLGRLRQESVDWAQQRGTHYFVADCDNFILPETIETLYNTGLPVIGPLVKNGDDPASLYADYHHCTDANGYYQSCQHYFDIWGQTVKGLIQVDVIHCTYLLRNEVLQHITYDDGSGRYEYVIMSYTLRKLGIPQYIDNRKLYGKLTFCDTEETFKQKDMTV
jgi:hypothetical protein